MWGPCTTDRIDSDKQIIDPEFAAKGLQTWLATGGNIREMHQPKAIGVGVSLERQGNQHWLKSRIVEPVACKLASEGVLRSYSVGISNARIDYAKNPKARGGTIVGGDFVEVSLVDRPANADCKVDLVKATATGDAEFTDILYKAADDGDGDDGEKCPLCKGTGKIREGHVTCPKCHGTGKAAEAEPDTTKTVDPELAKAAAEWYMLIKRDMDPDVGGGVDRDRIPAEDFAGKNRTYPIVTPADVDDAAKSIGRAGDDNFPSDELKANIIAIAKRKGPKYVEQLPQKWQDELAGKTSKGKKGSGKVPDADKEVTDALGEADQAIDEAQAAQAKDNEGWESGKTQEDAKGGKYDADDDDDDSDDDDNKGKAAAPYTLKRLHDHLCPVYSHDTIVEAYPTASKLRDALDVSYWAKAVTEAIAEDGGSGKLASTLADLSECYGTAVQLARQDDTVLDEAIADLRKSFADMYPNVHVSPSNVQPGMFKRPFISSGRAGMHASGKPRIPLQARVPDAGQFERGYLSDGHAANSPSAGPAHAAKGKKGKKAEKRQFYSNNAKDQAAQAMATLHDYICAFHPDICSMKHEPEPDSASGAPLGVDVPDKPRKVDNQETARPEPKATKALLLEDGSVMTADTLDKMIAARVAKATVKLEKRNKKIAKRYRKAKTELDDLRAQADPSAMAYRGGMIGPKVDKSADAEPQDAEAVKRAEEVDWLRKQVRHPDAGVARPALEKLQSLVEPDELAKLLTGL